MNRAKFAIGQLVRHQRFDYRGVVVDVDPTFQLSEEWYEQVARSRPPKDQPWYHVLVDESDQMTYVAERHLAESTDTSPIKHPQIGEYFDEFRGGTYVPTHSLS